MDTVTVRRWIDAPASHIWKRLVDVAGMVANVPGLDLLELRSDTGTLEPFGVALVQRRHGHRIATLRVSTVSAQPPERLVLALSAGPSRWVVSVELDVLGPRTTDVSVHAVPGDAPAAGRTGTSATRFAAGRRRDADLALLLDALVRNAEHDADVRVPRHADDTVAASAPVRTGQRMSAGR